MTDIKTKKILVVDDDESTVTILRRLLKKSGFTSIFSALDAMQALHIVETAEEPFSLILSDHRMPEMKGSDLFKKIAGMSPETRRIIITGHQNFTEAVDDLNRGAIHQYITKPWENEDLLAKIITELNLHEQIRARENYYNITKRQNARLYKTARNLKEKENQFHKRIEQKKAGKAELAQYLEKIEKERRFQKKVFELYGLISWNVVISRESLLKTFEEIKAGVGTILGAVCKKNDIPFPRTGYPFQTDKKTGELADGVWDLIDLILHYAGRLAEPGLYEYGRKRLEAYRLEDYTGVPDIGELALKEGFISKDAFDAASEELADRRVQEPALSMERVLTEKDLLSRLDLSRLYVKRTLINTRIRDAAAAERLQKEKGVPEEKMNRAFVKQMNLFIERGSSVSIGELLVETGVIDENTRQAYFKESDEAGRPPTPARPGTEAAEDAERAAADELVDLEISEDRTKAFLHVDINKRKSLAASDILKILDVKGIRQGIADETLIEGYLKYSEQAGKNLVVAAGKKPVPGRDGRITYHFNTDYQRPGVIESDGSIDFKDRGEIPFVKENTLLAEKTPLKEGQAGIDIFGETIPPEEVRDQTLSGGSGTSFSEDGLKLFATTEGQPDLDARGVISVHKELAIKGDVSYKTGHINYEGNVVVSGTVREGFRVTCVDLTANSINGGIIDISGDLNVSQGIVNSTVNVQGNLMAMYIQSSAAEVFGTVTVTREIMESEMACGSEIFNEKGKVIDAVITAKKGMILSQVGTEKSGHATLKTGVDDYINRVFQRFDKRIKEKETQVQKLEKEKKEIEGKIFQLHKQAADLSFAHESKIGEVETLKQKFAGLKGKKTEMMALQKEIREREKAAEQFDAEIQTIFQRQDALMKRVEEKEKTMETVSEQITEIRAEKDALAEIAALEKPNPFVKIMHRATGGTRIYGPHTSMIVKHTLRPCKILEIASGDPADPEEWKLVIQNL